MNEAIIEFRIFLLHMLLPSICYPLLSLCCCEIRLENGSGCEKFFSACNPPQVKSPHVPALTPHLPPPLQLSRRPFWQHLQLLSLRRPSSMSCRKSHHPSCSPLLYFLASSMRAFLFFCTSSNSAVPF